MYRTAARDQSHRVTRGLLDACVIDSLTVEASTPAQPGRIDVGGVISETFETYRQNAGVLIGSAVVVFVVLGLVSGLLSNAGGLLLSLLALVIRMAGSALYTGFVVKLVEDVRDGRRDFSVGDLFSAAAPAIGPLVLMSILWGLAVAVGFLLLIVPGLFLITICAVTAPSIVIDRVGVMESFGRSRELVRGNGWSVFGTLVVVWLITIVIAAVISAIGAALGTGGFVIGVIISSAVTAPIFSLAVSVIYFNLRGGRAPTEGAPAPSPPAPPPPA